MGSLVSSPARQRMDANDYANFVPGVQEPSNPLPKERAWANYWADTGSPEPATVTGQPLVTETIAEPSKPSSEIAKSLLLKSKKTTGAPRTTSSVAVAQTKAGPEEEDLTEDVNDDVRTDNPAGL